MTPRPPAARSAGDIRGVILDRDGTLIRRVPYLHDPAGVELLPTVVQGLQLLRESGCTLFLHTNQSGIGRGKFTMRDAEACNARMLELLAVDDLFARICIAPEAPTETPTYRKPSPRFGLEIMAEWRIAPHELCYVGDNISDLQTADALGCAGVGVDTGGHDLRDRQQDRGLKRAYPVYDSFIEAARHITGSVVAPR